MINSSQSNNVHPYFNHVHNGRQLALLLRQIAKNTDVDSLEFMLKFSPNINDFFQRDQDFYTFFVLCRHMDRAELKIIFKALKPALLKTNVNTFSRILRYASRAQVFALFEECLDEIAYLIKDASQIPIVFKGFSANSESKVNCFAPYANVSESLFLS